MSRVTPIPGLLSIGPKHPSLTIKGALFPEGKKSIILMLCLFRRKIFYWKCFPYFLMFGAIENNSQTENIFDLTKKAYLVLKNDLYF